jgi:hypothetical protein
MVEATDITKNNNIRIDEKGREHSALEEWLVRLRRGS